jgi:MYXO-CTERM domain-containing protein
MRKTLAVAAATGSLLFGGAGIANATEPSVPAPSTTTVAQNGDDTNANHHSDKTGLWGLLGLAGLAGLAGLRRRNDVAATTATTRGQTPGV